MLGGILSPAFLQAAGQAGKKVTDRITLVSLGGDPTIGSITGVGDIVVTSIKNGVRQSQTYTGGLSEASISIQADANTKITIDGEVSAIMTGIGDESDMLYVTVNSEHLTDLNCRFNHELRAINIIHAPALISFNCDQCNEIHGTIDLSKATVLQTVYVGRCHNMTTLDLRNTTITSLNAEESYALKSIINGDMSNIETLTLKTCSDIREIDLTGAALLDKLNINECRQLTNIRGIQDAVSLTEIKMDGCHELEYADFSNLPLLKTISAIADYSLHTLNIQGCVSIQSINAYVCYDLNNISFNDSTLLTTLNLTGCSELKELDLSKNTQLTSLSCSGCSRVAEIYTLATNSSVATAIANLITANADLQGTVYVNSADAYYSTIETAAQAANWTIEPLPA